MNELHEVAQLLEEVGEYGMTAEVVCQALIIAADSGCSPAEAVSQAKDEWVK